jgi:predicted esterase
MVLHAKSDRIVPFHHGEELYRIAQQSTEGENVSFVELRGGHNTGFSQSREKYGKAWADFLNQL